MTIKPLTSISSFSDNWIPFTIMDDSMKRKSDGKKSKKAKRLKKMNKLAGNPDDELETPPPDWKPDVEPEEEIKESVPDESEGTCHIKMF